MNSSHENPNNPPDGTNFASGIKPSPEDMYLSNSGQLQRKQVLRRRSHNMKQLSKCYRDHYWGLMEEVRVKYREYLWKFGISPFLQEIPKEIEKKNEEEKINNNNNNNVIIVDNNNNKGIVSDDVSVKCAFNGCKSKAMTLTKFCHVHILSDPKQQLYKPCQFFDKSSHGVLSPCLKPVLRSMVPCLCSMHFMKAQQHVFRALRKAGLNVTSTNRFAPKFHVIVTEYVREIQDRRKNNLSANKKKVVPKLEIDN
uniref:INO80 complex subunit D-like n=1 Tax=Erigeron canadensis TaxID=72917 RepID=UPI001CB9D30D|nr:INO80 complex subunit D-like [Erigeron canadensis]